MLDIYCKKYTIQYCMINRSMHKNVLSNEKENIPVMESMKYDQNHWQIRRRQMQGTCMGFRSREVVKSGRLD